jgi:hypothetical protein
MSGWAVGVGLLLVAFGVGAAFVSRRRFLRRRAKAFRAYTDRMPSDILDFPDSQIDASLRERWETEKDRWIWRGFLAAFFLLALYATTIWVIGLSRPQEVVIRGSQIDRVVERTRGSDEPAPATTLPVPSVASDDETPASSGETPDTTQAPPPTVAATQSGFMPDCADGAGRVFPVLEDPIPTDEASLTAVARRLREPAWTALRNLRATRPDVPLAGIVIIGSADKRPLSSERARYFGTNDGLAQARATVVAAALRHDPPEDVPSIALILNAGANIPGLQMPAATGADNRAVLICAVWGTE